MRITIEEILANRKLEVGRLKAANLLESFPMVRKGSGQFLHSKSNQLSVIGEMKPISPGRASVEHCRIEKIVQAYSSVACAVSVLTEQRFFGGSFQLLAQCRAHTKLPLLCKDFVYDVYQCLLARAAGAQAVLLIAKILNDNALTQLKQAIEALGMVAVIEVQNETELQRALYLDPTVILINNRDLNSFEVNIATTCRLAPLIPRNILRISASGINSHADINQLTPYCSVFLVGSALMQANDPAAKIAELTATQTVSASFSQEVVH